MRKCKALLFQGLLPWQLAPTMACVQQLVRATRFAVYSCLSDTASELQSLPCRPESFPAAAAKAQGVPEAAKRAGGRERDVQAFEATTPCTDKAFPCAPTSASIASLSARELPCGCFRGARRIRGRQARGMPREARASIRFSHLLLHVYRDTPQPPVGSAPKMLTMKPAYLRTIAHFNLDVGIRPRTNSHANSVARDGH